MNYGRFFVQGLETEVFTFRKFVFQTKSHREYKLQL